MRALLRELIRGLPVLVIASLILISAAYSDGEERIALGTTGIVLLSAWSGAYLRGWWLWWEDTERTPEPPPEAS